MDIKNLKNHSLYTSSKDIKAITKPLFDYFGIKTFTFARHYKSKHRIIFPLSTCTEMTETAFQNVGSISGHSVLPQNSLYYTLNEHVAGITNHQIRRRYETQLTVQQERFNIANEFTIKKDHSAYFDLFEFGIPTSESNLILLKLIHNQDLLEHFIAYFYDQAQLIIAKSDKEKISFAEEKIKLDTENIITDVTVNSQNFIKDTKINKFHCLDPAGNATFLTHKEWLIASYLSNGNNTAKHIANKLSISNRTVEMHISNLNKKLMCFDRASLIKHLNTLNLINLG